MPCVRKCLTFNNLHAYVTTDQSLQVKNISKSTLTDRLSSPLLSQGYSSVSSKPDRMTSSGLGQFQLTHESSSHSHADESRQREELGLIRTLAEVHCLLAEVKIVTPS